MNLGSASIKIIISAQVGDGEPIEVGSADLTVTADANGKVALDLEQAIRDALCGHTACANHKPVQHRDGKPPWCNTCQKFGELGSNAGVLSHRVVVENQTGRPEPILTPEQWGMLHSRGWPTK